MLGTTQIDLQRFGWALLSASALGISLVFAELKDPVREKVEPYGLTRTIDPRHFFPTIESAVAAYRQETRAEWNDAHQPPMT